MAHLLSPLRQIFYDNNGERLAGGTVETYAAGTTTPLVTYSDYDEVENTNPIVLNSVGEADIWLGDNAYKFVIKDSDGVTIRTIDDVSAINNGSITTSKIATDAVTKEKINADVAGLGLGQNVDGSLQVNVDNSTLEISTDVVRVKDSGIVTAKIAADAVTTAKILNANVTTAKLADGAVTAEKISASLLGLIKKQPFLNWAAIGYQPIGVQFNASTNMFSGFRPPNGSTIIFQSIHTNVLVDPDDGSPGTPVTGAYKNAGFSISTDYFVVNSSDSGFQIAASLGGSAIDVLETGSGIARSTILNPGYQDIACGDGAVIAVSGTGVVMRSIDGGSKWAFVAPAEVNIWNSIVYGDGVFVAVAGNGTNRVMRSTDGGTTWTAVAAAEANPWVAVGFGNDVFIAFSSLGTNRIMRSTNAGVSWSAIAAPEDNSWRAPVYVNGVFVTVSGNGTNRVMRSEDDGATWEVVPAAEDNSWQSIATGDGVLIAVSTDGTNKIMRSVDEGQTWTAIEAAVDNSALVDVAYGAGVFIAGCSAGSEHFALLSADLGLTWEPIYPPDTSMNTVFGFGGGTAIPNISDITFGMGRFIAVGNDPQAVITRSNAGSEA